MKLGLFLQPAIPPETPLHDAHETVLEMIRNADELGYAEAWIGEHFTTAWEPIPAPDLIVAQALKQTKNIKLAAGSHVLPYHNPVELAHRVAYMDHMAQGRLMLGIAAGGIPSDWELFDVDGKSGEHRKMTAEALDIMVKIWTEEESFQYKGDYWNANIVNSSLGGLSQRHIRPYQKPHPPIGVSGSNPNSSTLKLAGKYGFLPMSMAATERNVMDHWKSVVAGAAESGKTPKREDWRLVQYGMVADTDEEAYDLAVNGMMGESWRRYFIPLYKAANMLGKFRVDDSNDEINVDYLAKNVWLVGSPETVAKKLDRMYEASGGFGTFLLVGYDYQDKKDAFKKSMQLLQEEVLPQLKHPVAK